MVVTCKLCGREFEARSGASKYCDDCHKVKCRYCGREMVLKGEKFTRYLKRGWITCGSHECFLAASSDGAKDANGRRAETCLKRYGVRVPSMRRDVQEKARATMLERYGTTNVRELESFDVEAWRSKTFSDEAKAKKAATCLERYGATTRFHAADAEAKRVAVLRARREGDDMYRRVSEYVAGHPQATRPEIARALGEKYNTVTMCLFRHKGELDVPDAQSSRYEDSVEEFLKSLGVRYVKNDRSQIAPKELDFYIEHNGRKVGIEVNPLATHNMTFSPFGEPKPHRYHYDKTLACREKGIALVHAWEHCLPDFGGRCRFGSWEVLKNRIEHALGLTPVRHYARDMKVAEFPASDTRAFFDANNVNGYRRAETAYALVPRSVENPTPDDIVMAYAVGDAFFGKGRYDAEIARGACRLHETVVGGASKLWKHITGTGRYSSIVYYVDLNYYGADSMPDMDGVRFVEHRDSFWNFWTETGELKNREPRRNREITAGYRDGSVWKVENAGTDVYVWEKG